MMDSVETHWVDGLLLGVFVGATLLFGLGVSLKSARGTVQGYFLAGGSMTWLTVAASYYSSNIGGEHLVGLAGAGASSGYAMVLYEWLMIPVISLAAWFFVPVYRSARVYTLPEYMGKRFDSPVIRMYLALQSLLLYTITKLAVSTYSGVMFLRFALDWNTTASVVALVVVAMTYTVVGGLGAVMYSDTVQTAVMTIGSVALAVLSFKAVGGHAGIEERYPLAIADNITANSTCGLPEEYALHVWRPLDDPLPWLGILIQATIGCVWYWCNDQVTVQRLLAAKSMTHMKVAALVTSFLKFLPMWLMLMPGMAARILYPNEVGCVLPEECEAYCGNQLSCTNTAFPTLVTKLLPVGLRGILFAAMVSAILSSLTSIFNSSATLFSLDVWKILRPAAPNSELLLAGRIFAAVMCLAAVAWLPVVDSAQGSQLFNYIVVVQGYVGSLLGPVFFIAAIWPRANRWGTLAGLVVGHLLGTIKLIMTIVYPSPPCGVVDERPWLAAAQDMNASNVILAVVSVVMVGVSLATPAVDNDLAGLTWWTRWSDPESVKFATSQKVDNTSTGDNNNNLTGGIVYRLDNVGKESLTARWCRLLWFGTTEKHEDTTEKVNLHSDISAHDLLYEKPLWKETVNFFMGFLHIIMLVLIYLYW